MTSAKGKPQPEYDDTFKAKAVARLYAEGYPEKSGALRKIAKELGVTHPTLSRWARGKGSAPPTELIRVAVDSIEAVLEREMENILDAMEQVRDKADYKTLAISFGIIFDKYQLLRGAPTKRTVSEIHDLRSKSTAELEEIIEKAERMADVAFEEPELAVPDGASGDGEEDPS